MSDRVRRNFFARGVVVSVAFWTEANLSTDLESSRERFATCCQPHGNREGPTCLSASIGRTESRPSCWLGWGVV